MERTVTLNYEQVMAIEAVMLDKWIALDMKKNKTEETKKDMDRYEELLGMFTNIRREMRKEFA